MSGSGVYPASAGNAPPDAVPRTQAEWGQGERGPAGYEDSGTSGIFYYPAQLEAAEAAPPPVEAQLAGAAEEAAAAAGTEAPPPSGAAKEAEEAAELRRRMGWGAW